MKRTIFIYTSMLLLVSCQESSREQKQPSSIDLNETEQGQYVVTPKFTSFGLSLVDQENGTLLAGTLTLNLSCDNVFGTGTNGDWTMSSISATSTVSLIQNKACHITVSGYNDGSNSYAPVESPLVINIASNGAVSTSSIVQYTTGGGTPTLIWFAAAQGVSAYTIVLNFINELVSGNNTLSPTDLAATAVPLSIDGILAPVVSSLLLYSIPAINSALASYTLVGSVSNFTSCKYIDNSSSIYTPTAWSSVNTAFNAVGAQACPSLVPGVGNFANGNWTSLWGAGVKTLIMWANTVNGLNAYTTANIGP